MKSVTNLNSSVYYHGHYWNDIPEIAQYISQKLTGDKNKGWIENFKDKHATVPFKRALFLNCGDGRWEREFIDKKIVKDVEAFDVSPDLIKTAKKLKGGRKIKYHVADANKITFKENHYDLVVNIAALHHVQYLNRLCRLLAHSLKADGVFINYDFVGPSRNQYPIINYSLIRIVNLLLAKKIRKSPIGYPHLPTMLATDPTEAIHSGLIEKTLKRYFNIFERRVVGGGLAYELFTHNKYFAGGGRRNKKITAQIKNVLFADYLLTTIKVIPPFFSYSLSSPNKESLKQKTRVRNYQKKENWREKKSSLLYNTYTIKDLIIMFIHTNSWRKRIAMLGKAIKVNLIRNV